MHSTQHDFDHFIFQYHAVIAINGSQHNNNGFIITPYLHCNLEDDTKTSNDDTVDNEEEFSGEGELAHLLTDEQKIGMFAERSLLYQLYL